MRQNTARQTETPLHLVSEVDVRKATSETAVLQITSLFRILSVARYGIDVVGQQPDAIRVYLDDLQNVAEIGESLCSKIV